MKTRNPRLSWLAAAIAALLTLPSASAAAITGGLDAPVPVTGLAPAQRLRPPAPTAAPLPGCPPTGRAAVADKAAQRFWLCTDGAAVTDRLPMTTASARYGLPPIGTYRVFAKDAVATGIGGERLERFVAFYTTARGNRIAFHQYVNQDPATIGDLDMRGASSGCFRVTTADSWKVWNHLRIGDKVVILTA